MDLYFAAKFWVNIIFVGLLTVITLALFITAAIENKRRHKK